MRHEGCLQPTFCRACGACEDEADACNPRFAVNEGHVGTKRMPAAHVLSCLRGQRHACNPHFAVPALPARTKRMHATHVLQCLRCLRGRRGCLQPTFCRACGACEDEGGACNPRFAAPGVPARPERMHAAHIMPAVPTTTTRMFVSHKRRKSKVRRKLDLV